MVKMPDAKLYIASDSRDEILPAFARWNPLPVATFAADDRIGDLLALSRADALGFGNSSYGRLAGLLAAEGQRQAVADFSAKALVACDTWNDRPFWAHFGPVAAKDDPATRLKSRPWRKRLKAWFKRRGI